MSLFFALILVGVQAAPPAPAPADQQAIQAAGQAFGQCVSAKIASAPATGTPEAAADAVWAMCGTQWATLETAVNKIVANAAPDQQALAHEQMLGGVAQGKAQIAEGIRQMRAAHAAAPTTSATPTPPTGH